MRPPRGPAVKRGVFATRSPHRPNPIGLTAVELHSIKGRILTIGPCDLIDGTPILDIKPYIPAVDSFPNASPGWIRSVPTEERYTVELSPEATAQIEWLREHFGIDFITRALELLAIDPRPHRTRRIVATADGFRMGCGGWRVNFLVNDTQVSIHSIGPGYPKSYLEDRSLSKIPDREAQRAFMVRWPTSAAPRSKRAR